MSAVVVDQVTRVIASADEDVRTMRLVGLAVPTCARLVSDQGLEVAGVD